MAEEQKKEQKPKTAETKPRAAEAKPKAPVAKPKAAKATPKALEAKPKAAEAKPKAPKAAEAKPKATEAKPKAPKAAEAKPKAAEAKPKAAGAKPKAAEAKPKTEAKPKPEKAEKELEIVEGEIETEEEEKPARVPKVRPVLGQDLKWALTIRKERKDKQPEFRRQEWFRYKKLQKTGYRRPHGLHSKMRMHWKYRPPMARIGYRGPKEARGLHPSGFREVLIHNETSLDGIDPKTQAVRIGHSVGGRKRQKIQDKADELGIRVLNRW